MIGHTLATALLLLFTSGLQMITGHLNVNPDYYKFTVPYQRVVTATLTGMKADADLYLLDSEGKQITVSANTGNLAENINTSLAAGDYYLQVKPKPLQPEDDYQLKVDQGLTSDIAWRNTSTGANNVWRMNGTTVGTTNNITSLSGANWVLGGSGDFNGDGFADLVYRNTSSNQITVWTMGKDGLTRLTTQDIDTNDGDTGWTVANWELSAIGDMNKDGTPDLLWRNSTTGQVEVWLIKDFKRIRSISIGTVNSPWTIGGLGDQNNDGNLDIYWRSLDNVTGNNVVWLMDGTSYQSTFNLAAVPLSDWRMRGVADFNSDGFVDILWRRLSSPWTDLIWLMNGGASSTSTVTISNISGTVWSSSAPYLYANDPASIDIAPGTAATAYPIDNGVSASGSAEYYGSIGSSSDRDDYYKITTAGPANILVTLDNTLDSGDQATVDLRNSSDVSITSTNVNSGFLAQLSSFQSAAGTFYVKVSESAVQDTNGIAEKYRLAVEVTPQFSSSATITNFANINIGSSGLEPLNLVTFKNKYFFLDSSESSSGLWVTDGTAKGTNQVFPAILEGYELASAGNYLYFTAYDPTYGVELFKSDGTTDGTVLVKDINSIGDSNPSEFLANGSILFFNASDGTNGTELWKTDGTSSGTVLVKNINTIVNGDGTPGGSNPNSLTLFKGKVYFSAFTAASGYEPWVSDGTTAGTTLLKEISYRAADNIPDSSPYGFIPVGDSLFFVAKEYVNPAGTDTGAGISLWRTDGTTAGTFLVKDINPTAHYGDAGDTDIYELARIGNTLFLSATNGTNGYQLWKSNGTTSGTTIVKTVTGGADPVELTPVGNILYYAGKDSSGGVELWKSDGTTAGTVQVKDIYSGATGSYPHDLTNINGILYFSAKDSTTGQELWKSDGTSVGTVQVKDIYIGSEGSSPSGLKTLGNDNFIFFASTEQDGLELYRSNGCASGTSQIVDLSKDFGPVNPDFTSNGTISIFAMNSPGKGEELWKTDGTTGGTVLVKDIIPGLDGSEPSEFTLMGTTFYFIAKDTSQGFKLYKSDGTSSGTTLVHTSGTEFNVHSLVINGSTLYFIGQTESAGVLTTSLYKTDGTNAGTFKVKDLNTNGDPVYDAVMMGSTLFFTASDGTNGYELWKSDGTTGGTVLVKDINPTGDSLPLSLTVNSSVLYFSANDGSNGTELWKSDGTTVGTVLVKNIDTTSGVGSNPKELTVMGSTLYFSAGTPASGTELWKSDGTSGGTVQVKDINTGGTGGAFGSSPGNLTVVGSNLFFRANSSTGGYELWKSDGTSANTVQVKDIVPGTDSSIPDGLVNLSGTLYFVADSPTAGYELWKSDGISSGTVQVQDFNPGLDDGVQGVQVVGSSLYFLTGQPTVVKFWKI